MLDTDSPREPAKVIADILQAEMGLDDAHCLLGDQEWSLPEDEELLVIVFDKSSKRISSSTFMDTSASPPTEVQRMAALHDIMIEIMSYKSNLARVRKEEVGLALCSFYAQQWSSANNCQISATQAPLDASESELTGRLVRYVIHVNVTALHIKTKELPLYYDKFNRGATNQDPIKPPEVTQS